MPVPDASSPSVDSDGGLLRGAVEPQHHHTPPPSPTADAAATCCSGTRATVGVCGTCSGLVGCAALATRYPTPCRPTSAAYARHRRPSQPPSLPLPPRRRRRHPLALSPPRAASAAAVSGFHNLCSRDVASEQRHRSCCWRTLLPRRGSGRKKGTALQVRESVHHRILVLLATSAYLNLTELFEPVDAEQVDINGLRELCHSW